MVETHLMNALNRGRGLPRPLCATLHPRKPLCSLGLREGGRKSLAA